MISAAVQQELNLNYQVSLYFAYDLPNKRINIVNNSRTSVAVWGYRLDRKDEFFHEPIVISVHAMANLDNKEFFEKSSKEIPRQPRNVFHTTPFVLYLRSADGKDFEADCTLHAGWQENGFEVSMSNSSIKTSDWSAKARTPAQ